MTTAYQFLVAGVGYFLLGSLLNHLQDGEQTLTDIAIQALIFGVLMTIFWRGYRLYLQRK
jgi:hypothetical protein